VNKVNFKDIAVNLISSFGYIGLGLGMLMEFIGLPFPGEIALGFAGFMVWRGVLEFTPTLVAALGFSWLGSMLAYFLGASLGRPFVLKYGKYGGLDEEKMEKVEEWFSSRRVVVLIFGRFISGVRPLSAYVAGMAGMPWLSFAVLSFIGTAIWSSTFLSAGMFLGAKWENMQSYSILVGLFFLGLSVILIYYLWRRKNKQEENND
jgi:membrane protein DedA with SNARE-associated domain